MRDFGQSHVFYIRVKKEFYCDNLLLILPLFYQEFPLRWQYRMSIMISFCVNGTSFH